LSAWLSEAKPSTWNADKATGANVLYKDRLQQVTDRWRCSFLPGVYTFFEDTGRDERLGELGGGGVNSGAKAVSAPWMHRREGQSKQEGRLSAGTEKPCHRVVLVWGSRILQPRYEPAPTMDKLVRWDQTKEQ